MKILKLIRNIIFGVLLGIYLLFIVAVSSLLLNRNDYGTTQFGENAFIIIDEDISNDNYDNGDLVIVKEKDIDELKIGDEVFVYSPDNKEKTVNILISTISEINIDNPDNPYIVLSNDGGSWGIEYVAGIADTVYDSIGKYMSIIQSKWIFFIILIVPCFFILLYEIYLLIVSIKYDDDEEEILENKIDDKIEEHVSENIESKLNDIIEDKVDEKLDEKTIEIKLEEKIDEKVDAIIEETNEEINKPDEKIEEKKNNSESIKNIKDIEKDVIKTIDKHDNDLNKAADKLISESDDVENELLMLKEKLLAEKKEKEKKENVERLLKEINDLKKELDK